MRATVPLAQRAGSCDRAPTTSPSGRKGRGLPSQEKRELPPWECRDQDIVLFCFVLCISPLALGLVAKMQGLLCSPLKRVKITCDTGKMLGGTVSTFAPVSVCPEREARETEKGPLENLNISRYLNHGTWGFAPPTQAFFSSWEGEREKLGLLGRTLLLPIPGVGRAVPGCRSSEGVFAPWPWVL